jgi:ABC-type bacteriocin/lantibiotic exporter with double-glycine peptidase domain
VEASKTPKKERGIRPHQAIILSGYLTKNKKLLLGASLFAILSSVLVAVSPYLLSIIIDNCDQLSSTQLVYSILGFSLAIMGGVLTNMGKRLTLDQLKKVIMMQMRHDVVTHLFQFPSTKFRDKPQEYYISLLISEAQTYYEVYYESFVGIIVQGFSTLTILLITFFLNYWFGLIVLGLTSLILLFPKFFQRRMVSKRQDMMQENANYLTALSGLLAGHELANDITLPGLMAEHEKASFQKSEAIHHFDRFYVMLESLAEGWVHLINITVFCVGILFLVLNKMTLGQFASILLVLELFLETLHGLMTHHIAFSSSTPYTEKFLQLLSSSHPEYKPMKFAKQIALKHVSLKLDQLAIHDFSFTFERQKKYAIVGKVGSGKSSILKLLRGFYTPTSGTIKVDSNPLSVFDPALLFSEVQQDVYVFSASVMDNITLFQTFVSPHLDEYIQKLEAQDLVEEKVGEHGNKLSAGEKTQLGLLRALNREDPVLLLDDPFSHLDQETKAHFEQFLIKLDVTLIAVTHDYSYASLKLYDEILVMEEGELKAVFPKLERAKYREFLDSIYHEL